MIGAYTENGNVQNIKTSTSIAVVPRTGSIIQAYCATHIDLHLYAYLTQTVCRCGI